MHIQEDSATLRELAARCKDAKERERLRALYALSIGQSITIVRNIFCVEESTIHRWIERWGSEKNLADKPKSGRPPTLDEKDKSELKNLVEENNPKKVRDKCLVLGYTGTSEILHEKGQGSLKGNH